MSSGLQRRVGDADRADGAVGIAEREDARSPGCWESGDLGAARVGLLDRAGRAGGGLMDRSRARDQRRSRTPDRDSDAVVSTASPNSSETNAFIAAFVGGLVFGAASGTWPRTFFGSPERSQPICWASSSGFCSADFCCGVFEVGIRFNVGGHRSSGADPAQVIPVTLAMIRTGFDRRTIAFLRLVPVRAARPPSSSDCWLENSAGFRRSSPISTVFSMTVLISVFARIHRRTDMQTYGQWVERMALRSAWSRRSNRGHRVSHTGH